MNSPLQLKQSVFSEIAIKANLDNPVRRTATIDTLTNLDVKEVPQNSRTWSLRLRVKFEGDNEVIPYTGHVHCIGEFDVDRKYPEDQIEKLVFVNGAGMLYGSIRELVASLTGRGPWGQMFLPSISFLPIAEALIEQRNSKRQRDEESHKTRQVSKRKVTAKKLKP